MYDRSRENINTTLLNTKTFSSFTEIKIKQKTQLKVHHKVESLKANNKIQESGFRLFLGVAGTFCYRTEYL
jgi:hypothetical protein